MPRYRSTALALAPWALGFALLLGASLTRQSLRISRVLPQGRLTAQRTQAFERIAPQARQRVLILGDSTAVGVGAVDPQASLAGLLARDLPEAEIVNLGRAGATVADSLHALREASAAGPRRWPRFDLVVIQAGGNDVLKLTSLARLRLSVRRLLDALGDDAKRCVWLSPANVGLAPVFVAPFSWWLSARSHKLVTLLRGEVQARGGRFVSFCHGRADDPFSRDPATWFAEDGLHPSGASYRWCYRQALRDQVMQVGAAVPRPIGSRARALPVSVARGTEIVGAGAPAQPLVQRAGLTS
jgi:lysophospholipase L1-like esterase